MGAGCDWLSAARPCGGVPRLAGRRAAAGERWSGEAEAGGRPREVREGPGGGGGERGPSPARGRPQPPGAPASGPAVLGSSVCAARGWSWGVRAGPAGGRGDEAAPRVRLGRQRLHLSGVRTVNGCVRGSWLCEGVEC